MGDQDDPEGSSLKEELKKAMRDNVIPFPKPKKKRASSKTAQVTIKGDRNIVGNHNIQTDQVHITTQAPNLKIMPPPGSIGADPLLKQSIQARFNKLGEARALRFPGSAYEMMYAIFKNDFGIKNNKWTIIWTWPRECAPAIIEYLDDKYANTIPGRLQKATQRKNYLHTRPRLYQREKEILTFFGLEIGSPEVKKALHEYFGVTTHTKLSHLDHWQWVCYLEELLKKMEGS